MVGRRSRKYSRWGGGKRAVEDDCLEGVHAWGEKAVRGIRSKGEEKELERRKA